MRLFLGAPVPAEQLGPLAARLRADHPDLRLVPDGSWHLTLRFLGEIHSPEARERLVADVTDSLRGHQTLPVRLQGLGAFPDPGAARVVWVGAKAPGIGRLAERLAGATALYGEPPDPRPYQAHVTLGRMKIGGDLSRECHEYRETMLGEGTLDRVVMWASRLTPSGPHYDPVYQWALDA